MLGLISGLISMSTSDFTLDINKPAGITSGDAERRLTWAVRVHFSQSEVPERGGRTSSSGTSACDRVPSCGLSS
jgi:hypothetical protein